MTNEEKKYNKLLLPGPPCFLTQNKDFGGTGISCFILQVPGHTNLDFPPSTSISSKRSLCTSLQSLGFLKTLQLYSRITWKPETSMFLTYVNQSEENELSRSPHCGRRIVVVASVTEPQEVVRGPGGLGQQLGARE